MLVDTGDAYRPVPARLVAAIETGRDRIRLTPEGEEAFAAAPEVEPQVVRTDTPTLIRYMPRDLERLIVAGEPVPPRRSRRWVVGAVLGAVGGVGLMAGPVLVAEGVGGRARWLWIVLPLAVLAAGIWVIWTAMSSESERPLSRREKLWDAATAVLAISPRTRKRG